MFKALSKLFENDLTNLLEDINMGIKDDFTKEEWSTILFTPLWTFSIVAGADEEIDDKEMEALSEIFGNISHFDTAFTRDVLAELNKSLNIISEEYKGDPRDVSTGLQEAADLLDQKLPDKEANDFKLDMILLGLHIAESSGGFWGGKISRMEVAAIITAAIQLRWNPNL